MIKPHERPGSYRQNKCRALLFIAILALTYAVYYPGLKGPFLFDDFANIDALGRYGGIRDYDTLRSYLFGGIAGPTGNRKTLMDDIKAQEPRDEGD